MARVTFYFDGFNFYNGIKQAAVQNRVWRQFYWIDLFKFCQQFVNEPDHIHKIKYFTADPLNQLQRSRHQNFFKLNLALNSPILYLIQGKYKSKNITCKICHNVFQTAEEKRTDVNISITMLNDCARNYTDTLVLVSGDSDLVPVIEIIKRDYPEKKLKVYFPPMRNSTELFNAAGKKVVFLNNNIPKFKNAVMPDRVIAAGITFCIPQEWKIRIH